MLFDGRNSSRIEKQSSINKPLSDIEDSLIISEKKQRTSISKGSKSSSIVDVKIKPICNMKHGPNSSPNKHESFENDYE